MYKPLIFAAVLAAATPAWAQSAPPAATTAAPAPATPEQIATARAEAARIIADAGAGEFFVNTTDSVVPEVRHTLSGLTCSFAPGDSENRINVYEFEGIPRSANVSCATQVAGVFHTLYATRYAPPKSGKDCLTDAVEAIKYRWTDAKWYDGQTIETSIERPDKAPLPQTWLAHYVVKLGEVDHYTVARCTELNGWSYKQRLTVPLEEVTTGQLYGNTAWSLLLIGLTDRSAI